MSKESFWLNEYIVSKAKNCVPISSICKSKCIFCSNNNNPFKFPKKEHRSIDDIRKNLQLVQLDSEIRLSENIPGRINEGESLLHKEIWQILDMVRERYPNVNIIFATNGITLTEEFVMMLSTYKPIAIDTLSLNSSNIDNWLKLNKISRKYAEIAIDSPKILNTYKIPYIASLVAMPKITGYDDIYNTIIYAYNNGCSKFYVWMPGYTNFTPKENVNLMEVDENELKKIIQIARNETGIPISIMPREVNKESIKNYVNKIMSLSKDNDNNLLLTSVAAYDSIKEIFKDNSSVLINNLVYPVKNQTYGGNIIVSGLLMVSDFKNSYKEFMSTYPDINITRIFVPSEPFDLLGRDLLYNYITDLEGISNCPVYQL